MFLISDDYGDFKRIMSYKEARELLINEIVEETQQNCGEYDIVESNTKQLGKIAKDNALNEKYLVENLQSFGWYVVNVLDIQRHLNNLREYLFSINGDDKIVKELDDILNYMDKELK